MASRVQRAIHSGGVAGGDYIELAFSTPVTAGNRILIFGGSYQGAIINSSFLSQSSGTATLGPFSVDGSDSRFDNFACAIASAVVVTTGTSTIRLDVTGNNYYNLYIEEWEGLGPAVASAAGTNGLDMSSNHAETDAFQSSVHGIAFGMFTQGSSTVTVTEGSGWTLQDEFEDNSTTLMYSVISRTAAPNTSYTAEWALGGVVSWICCAAIYALDSPLVFGHGHTAGDTTAGGAVASYAQNLSYRPTAGSRIYVGFPLWSESVPGFTNQGMNPTAAMISDNMGNASGDYVEIGELDKSDIVPPGDPNTPGLAWFESPALQESDIEAADGTYTVTVDVDPGGSGEAYWTQGVVVIKTPHADDEERIASVSHDRLPTDALPGLLPTIIPYGTGTKTKDHWIALTVGHNRGHRGGTTIHAPTEGGTWTLVISEAENSETTAGHVYHLEGTDGGNLTPTQVVDEPGADTVTATRGLMVIVNLADGEDIGAADQEASLPFVGSAAQTFAPIVEQNVTLATLASSAQVFVVALALNVALATLTNTSQPFAPTLELAVTTPTVTSDEQAFAPVVTLEGTIAVPFVTSAADVFLPSVALNVALPTLTGVPQTFVPVVFRDQVMTLPTIASGEQAFEPLVTNDALGMVLPTIASTVQIPTPSVAAGAVALVAAFVASAAQIFAPIVGEAPRRAWGRLGRSGFVRRITLAVTQRGAGMS